MDSTLHTLAAHTASPAAQRVLAGLGPDAVAAILANQYCDPVLFQELYTTVGRNKVSVANAKSAVVMGLPEDKLRHVLSVEKRAGVLASAFGSVIPTMDELMTEPLLTACSNAGAANVFVAHWGAELDVDRLAEHPGHAFGASLRVRRMLSNKVTDEDVVAELTDFDEWGSNKYKALVAWVLHQRPQLLTRLIPMPSSMLRTLVAGMSLVGLSPEEQANLLNLDKMAGKDHTWFEEHKYGWMAAAGNPTVSFTLIDLIEEGLAKTHQDGSFNAVGSRREYNAWDIDTFDRDFEPATIGRLVKWSAPSETVKGRPTAFVDIIAHKSVSDADARVAAARFRKVDYENEILDAWLMPQVREALQALESRFPSLGNETTEHWDTLNRNQGPNVLRHTRYTRDPAETDTRPTPLDTVPGHRTNTIGSGYGGAIMWLEEQLGEDETLWRTVINLMPTMLQDTLQELVDMTRAVSV
jgi:hypothetical protein